MRWLYVLPVLTLALVAAFFGHALTSGRNPESIGSPLVGRAAPATDLAPLRAGGDKLDMTALRGRPTLVNFFASWCAPCRAEHPLLMSLAREGRLRLVGINYKDKPADAETFLSRLGDPYERIGVDPQGRAFIDWGLTGVPETFLVDAAGVVRLHFRGPLTERDVRETLLPKLRELGR